MSMVIIGFIPWKTYLKNGCFKWMITRKMAKTLKLVRHPNWSESKQTFSIICRV